MPTDTKNPLVPQHPTHTAILRDGLAVAVVHHSDVPAWLANEYGPHTLETGRELVKGWQSFVLFAGRRGYGINGAISRLAVELAYLVRSIEEEWAEGERGGWTDYVAGPELSAMLGGFVGMLNYTAPGDNVFDAIRGKLHGWAHETAARIHFPLDA